MTSPKIKRSTAKLFGFKISLTARENVLLTRLIFWAKKIVQSGVLSFVYKGWGWRPTVMVFVALLSIETLDATHKFIRMLDSKI